VRKDSETIPTARPLATSTTMIARADITASMAAARRARTHVLGTASPKAAFLFMGACTPSCDKVEEPSLRRSVRNFTAVPNRYFTPRISYSLAWLLAVEE
jgi:hypothetical protein